MDTMSIHLGGIAASLLKYIAIAHYFGRGMHEARDNSKLYRRFDKRPPYMG